nr:E3 ubiquitin-protein ligase synoviolin B-like [Kaumoebavirus]
MENACPICLEEQSLLHTTNCKQCNGSFHEKCLRDWAKHKNECPVCRQEEVVKFSALRKCWNETRCNMNSPWISSTLIVWLALAVFAVMYGSGSGKYVLFWVGISMLCSFGIFASVLTVLLMYLAIRSRGDI